MARGKARTRKKSQAVDFSRVAMDLLLQSAQDPRLWQGLMSTPAVASCARKALEAKVRRDRPFAQSLAMLALTGAPLVPVPAVALGTAAVPAVAVPAAATPRTPSESDCESPPRKVRRRLRFKQGYDAKLELIAESSIGSLSLDLTVYILSFVEVATKLKSLAVSRGLREVLQHRGCWDPLKVGKEAGRGLLRKLKQQDPLGYFTEERLKAKKGFPRGFFEVCSLEIVLMDPERVEMVQSDTEDEAPRPLLTSIPDPLDEMLKRLKHYFTKICDLTIRNIEDYRMDYRFVELRCNELETFTFVELRHEEATYHLRASRHVEPRRVELASAQAMNASRVPEGVEVKTTNISEREALFLQEHRSAFKNGNDFCLCHSIYRYVPSHTVRKRYKAVMESLRRRFPRSFDSRAS